MKKQFLYLLKQHFKIEQLKIYDDSFNSENLEYINDVLLVGTISDIDNDEKVFISIGDNKKREEYFDFFHTKVIEDNFIHDKVYLENNRKAISISVHNNAAGADGKWHSAKGWQVYISLNASNNSKRLAKIFYDEAIS